MNISFTDHLPERFCGLRTANSQHMATPSKMYHGFNTKKNYKKKKH